MKYCAKCGNTLNRKIIDQKERLCCDDQSCGYIYWNNPIPVVAALVETEKGIVLAHNKLAPEGLFSFITGYLEADESPEYASARETKEELGLDAVESSLIGIFPFQKFNQIIIAYHIIATGQIQLNEELDECIIVQRTDLLGYTQSNRFEIDKWLDKFRVLA